MGAAVDEDLLLVIAAMCRDAPEWLLSRIVYSRGKLHCRLLRWGMGIVVPEKLMDYLYRTRTKNLESKIYSVVKRFVQPGDGKLSIRELCNRISRMGCK